MSCACSRSESSEDVSINSSEDTSISTPPIVTYGILGLGGIIGLYTLYAIFFSKKTKQLDAESWRGYSRYK